MILWFERNRIGKKKYFTEKKEGRRKIIRGTDNPITTCRHSDDFTVKAFPDSFYPLLVAGGFTRIYLSLTISPKIYKYCLLEKPSPSLLSLNFKLYRRGCLIYRRRIVNIRLFGKKGMWGTRIWCGFCRINGGEWRQSLGLLEPTHLDNTFRAGIDLSKIVDLYFRCMLILNIPKIPWAKLLSSDVETCEGCQKSNLHPPLEKYKKCIYM